MVNYKFLIVQGPDSYTVSIPEDSIELWSFNTARGSGQSNALCTWYDGSLRCRFVKENDLTRLSKKFGKIKHVGKNSWTKAGKNGRRRLQNKQHN